MAKHTCPNCQHFFETEAKKKQEEAPAQPTKFVDGVIYYGTMVNYSDGARMAWATFPHNEKHYAAIVKKHKAVHLARLKGRSDMGTRLGYDPNGGKFYGPKYIESGYFLNANTKVVPNA